MTVEPLTDYGQMMAPPAGKVIGFIDGKPGFDAFAAAVQAAGYPAEKITSLYGEEGIHLVERLKENSFFFGDSEDSVIQLCLQELRQGHYVAAVEVTNHAQAVQITDLGRPHGGHNFSYFGTWVTEQLST